MAVAGVTTAGGEWEPLWRRCTVSLKPEDATWPRGAAVITAGTVFGDGDSSSHRWLVTEKRLSGVGECAVSFAVPAHLASPGIVRLELWWRNPDTGAASLAGRYQGGVAEGDRLEFRQSGRAQGAVTVTRVNLSAPPAAPPRGTVPGEKDIVPVPTPAPLEVKDTPPPWVPSTAKWVEAHLPPAASTAVARHRRRRGIPLEEHIGVPVEAYYASLKGEQLLDEGTEWMEAAAWAACLLADNAAARPKENALGIFLMMRCYTAVYTPDTRTDGGAEEQFSSLSATPAALSASEGDDCDGMTSAVLEVAEALEAYTGTHVLVLMLQRVMRDYTAVALDLTIRARLGGDDSGARCFHAAPALVRNDWLEARHAGKAWSEKADKPPIIFLEAALVTCHARKPSKSTWLWPRVCRVPRSVVALKRNIRVLSPPGDTAVGHLYLYVFAMYETGTARRTALCYRGEHGVPVDADWSEVRLVPDPTPGCETAEQVRICAAYASSHRPAAVAPRWKPHMGVVSQDGPGEWVVERDPGGNGRGVMREFYASLACRRGPTLTLGPGVCLAWVAPR